MFTGFEALSVDTLKISLLYLEVNPSSELNSKCLL